jgi:hypothetical protein
MELKTLASWLVLGAFVVTGCVASEWVRREAREADYMRDSSTCAQAAQQVDSPLTPVWRRTRGRRVDGDMYDGNLRAWFEHKR